MPTPITRTCTIATATSGAGLVAGAAAGLEGPAAPGGRAARTAPLPRPTPAPAASPQGLAPAAPDPAEPEPPSRPVAPC